MVVGLQLPVIFRMYRHTELIVLIKTSGLRLQGKRILSHRYFTGNIHLIIPLDPSGIQNYITLIISRIQTGNCFPGQFRVVVPSTEFIPRFSDVFRSRQLSSRIFRRSLIVLLKSSPVFLIVNSPLLTLLR